MLGGPLLVGEDDAGRAVGVGAAVVDAEGRRHGFRCERLLHRDLFAEEGVGVHGAVVVVLDRDLEQLLPGGAELVHVAVGEHGVVRRKGGPEDRLPLDLADPPHEGKDLGGAELGHLLAADHRHHPVQPGLNRHPRGADGGAPRGAGDLGQPGGLGVEAEVLLDHPGDRSLLVVLGHRANDRGVDDVAIDAGILDRRAKGFEGELLHGGVAAPSEAPVPDADDSDSCHFSPPLSNQ